jgi:hypothetical protein
MTGCPFYGFQWPERSSVLDHVGGNLCGLDLDRGRPCILEREGRPVNYRACPVVNARRSFVETGKHLIRFDLGDGRRPSLADWERETSWAGGRQNRTRHG